MSRSRGAWLLALASVVMLGGACDRGGGSAHPITTTAASDPGTRGGTASAPEGATATDPGAPMGSASATSSAIVTGPPPAGGCGPHIKQALDVVARCFRKAVTAHQREPKKLEGLGTFMSSAKLAGECSGMVTKPDGTVLVAEQAVHHRKTAGSWDHFDDGRAEVRFSYLFNIPGCKINASAPIEHVMGGH